MTNQEIVDYVINTPHNTNPVILKQMLKDVSSPGGNADLTGVVRSVNDKTPDENGNVEIETIPDELEQIALLVELDMLPAIQDANGAILTDENGNVILRY